MNNARPIRSSIPTPRGAVKKLFEGLLAAVPKLPLDTATQGQIVEYISSSQAIGGRHRSSNKQVAKGMVKNYAWIADAGWQALISQLAAHYGFTHSDDGDQVEAAEPPDEELPIVPDLPDTTCDEPDDSSVEPTTMQLFPPRQNKLQSADGATDVAEPSSSGGDERKLEDLAVALQALVAADAGHQQGIVELKLTMGQRLVRYLDDHCSGNNPAYGKRIMHRLAAFLDVAASELYACRTFASSYSSLADFQQQHPTCPLVWREVRRRLISLEHVVKTISGLASRLSVADRQQLAQRLSDLGLIVPAPGHQLSVPPTGASSAAVSGDRASA